MKKYHNDFDAVPVFCLFMGYPRSGHTLIGSLLNAHPQMLIAHEMHILQFIKNGMKNRNLLFAHLVAQAKWFSARGEKWTGYSYKVPNKWQGKFKELKVIGDKRGGATSRILKNNPILLEELQQIIGDKKIKIIHTYRNPYDNIATRARQGNYYKKNPSKERLAIEIDRHFEEVWAVDQIRQTQKYEIIEFKHEEFKDNPKKYLQELCSFLEVDASDDFINSCLKIVKEGKGKSRSKVPWDEALKQKVQQNIEKYEFLRDYTYEN